MITTQQEWKDYIVDSSVLQVQCNITLANGASLTLATDRIMEGTLQIHDEICDIGQIDIGGTVAQEISFSISNHDGQMSGYDFRGARCVLYLIANGVSIQKGVWTLYTNNTVGRVIPIYGYDHMADEQYNTPITSTISFNGMTAVNAIKSLGYTLENEDFPNASYVLPNVTTDDMDEGITKRDILGYICQLCGCYARFNNLGRLAIKYFNILDYSDDLDGGGFFVNVDDAYGGAFRGAYGRNKLPYPYTDGSKTENGVTFRRITDTGSQLAVYGTATALTRYRMRNGWRIPVGQYRITGCPDGSQTTYYLAVYKIVNNVATQIAYCLQNEISGHTMFSVESNSDLYVVAYVICEGTNMGDSLEESTILKPMLLEADDNSNEWDIYQEAWTGGDVADGGLFGFWGNTIQTSSNSDSYPLSKIMTEPKASLHRKLITGVKVTDINQEETVVGTEDYLIEIDSNPFIINQTVANAVATQAYTVVSGVNFFPFTVTWSADPSFEAGDLISFTSLGREFVTPCTSFDYQLGNMSTISCNENDLNNKVDY